MRGDIRAYTSRPTGEIKGAILVFHDIFGFASARTHHLCDEMAKWGYLVLAPDFFGEDLDGIMEYEDIFTIWAPWRFFTGQGSLFFRRVRVPWTTVEEKMDLALQWLRDNGAENKKVGALGFCWGGWAITRAATTGKFACAVGAHPAPHVQYFQAEGPGKFEMYSQIKCPVLFLPSSDDPKWYRPDGADFLEIKRVSPESKSVVYMDMIHGWVNRGDIRLENIKTQVEDAMAHTKEYFDRFVL